MDLVGALSRVRTLDDLPQFITELRHRSAWGEIPGAYWVSRRRPASSIRRSALIGFAGELPWYGIDGSDPARLARSLARDLQRRGESAALMVLDPASGCLALSATFDGLPVLLLDTQRVDGVARSCLGKLADVSFDGRLATAARIAQALAGEGIGARFFAAFEAQLERLTETIDRPTRLDDKRSLALLQLNRVLFLYFVQSKGWLDGRPDFLRTQVDRCLSGRKHLHRHLLRPLFFGTLNRPADRRTRVPLSFGRIPFLNGGLFEPHPLERQWGSGIPNHAWRGAFDDLFERFHFTIVEGASDAIAPDMLGRMFEGVMAPADRRNSGTFYTPPALVQTLIDECLTVLVSSRCGTPFAEAAHLLATRDPRLERLLSEITLLDPAVGSGAFLLGALERLAHLRYPESGTVSQLRRRILERNLFGVDINPTAVRLTELRLWLAVIADDPETDPGAVLPLPNLDCLVRQGDSLTDPLGLIARMPFRAGAMGQTLTELRRAFIVATGERKGDAARALRRSESAALAECVAFAEHEVERGVRECLAAARAPDLFGKMKGADRTLARRLGELRARRAPLRQARQRLERDGEIPWFQYESHFADVFTRSGGFDVIIGNPPWVRAEKLPPVVREQLGNRYHWWRGDTTQTTGYRHQPDLAVAFLERAHELAAPGGTIGLLVPSKIATAAYGTVARRALARDLTLHTISNLSGNREATFQATVYPMAIISTKARPSGNHQVKLELGPTTNRVAQRELEGGGPWILRGSVGHIVRDLARRFPVIADRFSIHLGVKTSANAVFLNPPSSVEPDLLREACRGRDIKPFRVARATPLLWPCDETGATLDRLPSGAHGYLMQHARTLGRRADQRDGPIWSLFRTGPATARFRVVWADLARRLTALALTTADHRRVIPLNSCYVMPTSDGRTARALAAWLNSTWLRALASLVADPASGGFFRFNARAVGRLPLPDSVVADERLSRIAEGGERDAFDQEILDDLAQAHLDLAPAALQTLASVAGAGAGHCR